MNRDQSLLDAADVRYEAEKKAEFERKQNLEALYKNAALKAHSYRLTANLISPKGQIPSWDDLSISSQKHLIADAQFVAENPNTTIVELHRNYQERLMAQGDIDNPDLKDLGGPNLLREEQVLEQLKKFVVRGSCIT